MKRNKAPKPPSRPRVVTIRLSAQEHAQLMEITCKSGLSREAVLRRLILGTKLRAKPPDSYTELVRQVSALGNNLNQIAHCANSERSIRPDQIEEAARILTDIWTLVRRAM